MGTSIKYTYQFSINLYNIITCESEKNIERDPLCNYCILLFSPFLNYYTVTPYYIILYYVLYTVLEKRQLKRINLWVV